MKKGVGKNGMLCYCFFLSIGGCEGFDTADVDSFIEISAIDFHSAIVMDFGDDEWTFGRFVHFWLYMPFV